MMKLRDYQKEILDLLLSSISNQFVQLETGAGKTAIISEFCKQSNCNVTIVAHRDSIIAQICNNLISIGIYPKVVANKSITKRIYNKVNIRGDRITVCSVATFAKRGLVVNEGVCIIDEAHHAITDNIWGKVVNTRCIGFSATPCRLDEKPLSRKEGGLFDELVQASSLKSDTYQKLVNRKILCDYEAYAPHSNNIDLSALRKSNNDYSIDSITDLINREFIFGDFINERMRLAKNKKTLVFCPSVENAKYIAEAYKQINISTTYISSKLTKAECERRLDAFRNNEVEILINVEMITEGFDLPDIECLQILRPTLSLVLHKQMIGRVLRYSQDKHHAIIIDHVGNCLKLCTPSDDINWSLEGKPIAQKSHKYSCLECGYLNSLYSKECVNCGATNHLLHDSKWENDQFVKAKFINDTLIKIERKNILLKKERERIEHYIAEKEKSLSVELITIWEYDNSLLGRICNELAKWYIDNLIKGSISIYDVNKLLQQSRPPISFFTDNFTKKDLQIVDDKSIKKCLRIYNKWLKSNQ